MTTAIRKYPEHQRQVIARRRIKNATKGLGYWASVDFDKAITKKQKNNLKGVSK